MNPDSSDISRALGRMDSERQLRNRPTTRWLDDVAHQADADQKTLVADIETRKARIDEMHDTFLASLDTVFTSSNPANIDRKRQAHDLLANGTALLTCYKTASDAVAAAFGGQDSVAVLQRKHEEDVQRLKEVLVVGKRLCAGELEGVEQQARARELMGRKEVWGQAAAVFGTGGEGKKKVGVGVERRLECVERGVRRMVRGMEG